MRWAKQIPEAQCRIQNLCDRENLTAAEPKWVEIALFPW
jgi:hypothetical protein